ncbi:hypothetical protein GCM10007108_15000 [Thermogymnomonas acidicola]|uniref:Uncharacterized protein n=1 Tax=Thermogymnomonas acidicola TaxID=399579 RepID=A0AA37F9X1_9ARCH|nr:hypothetical protein [Thermogymnomonas acidicola]GGM77831.1 hypothetical protein GCM10007108_15000 [Thermogymnomonas acidicola]
MSSILASAWATFLNNMRVDPYISLRFLLPVALVTIVVVALRLRGAVTRPDASPGTGQREEVFAVPGDYLTVNLKQAVSGNYEFFIRRMSGDIEAVRSLVAQFQECARNYSRFKAMSSSPFRRRRERGKEGMAREFERMMDTYRAIMGRRFTVIEVGHGAGDERVG